MNAEITANYIDACHLQKNFKVAAIRLSWISIAIKLAEENAVDLALQYRGDLVIKRMDGLNLTTFTGIIPDRKRMLPLLF